MLKFVRTKFVGYEKKNDQTIILYGTLDDTIYSMKVDLEVKLPELVISKINGEMRRFTTPYCQAANEYLSNAINIKIEPGFQSKIKRLIARPGCRHYGNIIIECLESLIPGLISIKYKEMVADNPDITMEQVITALREQYPQIRGFCPFTNSS